jgi:hypothetical protein
MSSWLHPGRPRLRVVVKRGPVRASRPSPGEAGVMSGRRVSRGEAEAVSQAAPTGGAIRPLVAAAGQIPWPSEGYFHGRIWADRTGH